MTDQPSEYPLQERVSLRQVLEQVEGKTEEGVSGQSANYFEKCLELLHQQNWETQRQLLALQSQTLLLIFSPFESYSLFQQVGKWLAVSCEVIN